MMIAEDFSKVTVVTEPVNPESVAEAFLMLLKLRGIDWFFINAGTDFAPIVEGYARVHDDNSDSFPTPVIATHENVVMGMAHGAYLMNGQAQAVMFHVNVGTANAVCGAMNAASEHVPLIICAGRSPIYEKGVIGARNTRVAWGQEMFDQAAILRETVKWEYELRGAAQVEDVIDRAFGVALTEPRGPVYLTLPREVLAAELETTIPSMRRCAATATSAGPDKAAIDCLADRLADARLPIISSLASGADKDSVSRLSTLCERFALGYAEEQSRYLNLPSDHLYHLGYAMAPYLAEADALLFVESDVPWIPERCSPRDDAFVAQAGLDPMFGSYPMRSHRSDLTITSGPTALFDALIDAMEQRKDRIDLRRADRLRNMGNESRNRIFAEVALERDRDGPITTAFLSQTLSRVLHNNCVLFNEYWADRSRFQFSKPGSYFYLPATGGLGWGLPAALGAKLADPDRTMVAAIGDGTYMFSNPAACHHASEKHRLPVLTVVANNSRWNAVDATSRLVYPHGHMAQRDWMAISDLRPSPALEQYCTASRGVGVVVERREDLEEALRQSLARVEGHSTQALVNVLCV